MPLVIWHLFNTDEWRWQCAQKWIDTDLYKVIYWFVYTFITIFSRYKYPAFYLLHKRKLQQQCKNSLIWFKSNYLISENSFQILPGNYSFPLSPFLIFSLVWALLPHRNSIIQTLEFYQTILRYVTSIEEEAAEFLFCAATVSCRKRWRRRKERKRNWQTN